MKSQNVSSIGIDVGKASLSFATMWENQKATVKSCTNDRQGINGLVATLRKNKTDALVPCVIEATGDYHLRCALMLKEAGFNVNVINPLISKYYQRTSVRNCKDDSVDAVRLARIGVLEPDLRLFTGTKQSFALRKAVTSVGKLEQYQQQLKAHAKQLREAEKMLGAKFDLGALEKTIKSIEKQITIFENYINEHAPTEAIDIAKHVRGVSRTGVAKILALLDGHEFESKDKLVAFTGLDVAARRSGSWRGKEKLSKRGSPHFRKILFQLAWGLKQHNQDYKEYYNKLRDRGLHYFTCLIATARKFLRFLYAYLWKKSISFS